MARGNSGFEPENPGFSTWFPPNRSSSSSISAPPNTAPSFFSVYLLLPLLASSQCISDCIRTHLPLIRADSPRDVKTKQVQQQSKSFHFRPLPLLVAPLLPPHRRRYSALKLGRVHNWTVLEKIVSNRQNHGQTQL